MISYIDDDLVAAIAELGGVSAIAISHPHFYGSMIEWAHAFDAPVYIHGKDREWVARPDDSVIFWDGDTREIGDGLTLVNAGVHFDGGQVLHWAAGPDGRGALFSGDIFTVVAGPPLGQLHAQLPQPDPGAAAHDPPRAVPDRAAALRPRLRRLVARRSRRRRRGGRPAFRGTVPQLRPRR